jgi:hypothetical protein
MWLCPLWKNDRGSVSIEEGQKNLKMQPEMSSTKKIKLCLDKQNSILIKGLFGSLSL